MSSPTYPNHQLPTGTTAASYISNTFQDLNTNSSAALTDLTTLFTKTDALQSEIDALEGSGSVDPLLDVYTGTTGGSANAYTFTVDGSTGAFTKLKILAYFHTPNTGASTLTVDSTTAKTIKAEVSIGEYRDVAPGELQGYVMVVYDGTYFVISKGAEAISNIRNSWDANLEKYYGQQKTFLTFEDYDDYTMVGATFTQIDNVLGGYGVQVAETDAGSTTATLKIENVAWDLSTFENGEEVTDDDFMQFIFEMDDVENFDTMVVSLGAGSTYDSANRFYKAIPASGGAYSSGYLAIVNMKIGDFTEAGSVSWASIRSFYLYMSATDGTSITTKLYGLKLCKADPEDSTRGWEFQSNGARDLDDIDDIQVTMVEEKGEIAIKYLGSESTGGVSRLELKGTYSNFTAAVCMAQGGNNYNIGIRWFAAGANQMYVSVVNDVFTFGFTDGGTTTTHTAELDIAEGDQLMFILGNDGAGNLIGGVVMNYDFNNAIIIPVASSITVAGTIRLMTTSANYDWWYGLSVSQIPSAHHAVVAEVAKNLAPRTYSNSAINELVASGTTYQTITLSTDDSGAMVDTADSSYRVIPKTAWYAIELNVYTPPGTSGDEVGARIEVDGTYVAGQSMLVTTATQAHMSVSRHVYCTKGQEVQPLLMQNSGSAVTFYGNFTIKEC